MDHAHMRQKVGAAIRELVEDYLRNVFTYLYEADLQAQLSHLLSVSLPDTVSTSPSAEHAGWFRDPAAIRTPIVHREYPDTKRFDVAIIDPRLVQSTAEYTKDNPTRKMDNEAVWTLRVMAGIELKHWKIGDATGRLVTEYLKDLKKLRDYEQDCRKSSLCEFTGIACLFVQSYEEDALPKLAEVGSKKGLTIGEPWDFNVERGVVGVVVSPRDGTRLVSDRA